MKKFSLLELFLAILICQLPGVLGSWVTLSNIPEWYDGLVKPVFTPPAWVFGPVWGMLYLMMGIALYQIWRCWPEHPKSRTAMSWFMVQLLLNALWSPLFFGLQFPLLGLVCIVLLWLAVGRTILTFLPVSRSAGFLLMPYWLWVTFATVLNASIFWLN